MRLDINTLPKEERLLWEVWFNGARINSAVCADEETGEMWLLDPDERNRIILDRNSPWRVRVKCYRGDVKLVRKPDWAPPELPDPSTLPALEEWEPPLYPPGFESYMCDQLPDSRG